MKSELTFTKEELCIIRNGLRSDFDKLGEWYSESTEKLFKKVSAEIKWLQEAERRGAEFCEILNAASRRRG